jgi:hypothetical protein
MNETPRGFFLFDEYSLENPLVHSSPHFREPIKHSLIKTTTYQNDAYICVTWEIQHGGSCRK